MTVGLDCVLGSGPAAVACAHELVKKGRKVVMIDPGRQLPADRVKLAEEFRAKPDPNKFVARLRELRRQLPSSMQSKRMPFSSSHVWDDIDRFLPVEAKGAMISRSLATGGLSSTWGATVMPLSARSFKSWPVTLEDMAPYYRDVAGIMDIPRIHDDLEKMYPNYGNALPTALSEQGAQLMANLVNHRQQLSKNGFTFGRCRSAVGSMYASNDQGCVYCGLCMYGCPYRAIFNAEYVIERLKSNPAFQHQTNRIAVGFEEKATGVSIHLRHMDTGSSEIMNCERLFIACGASTSLRLVATAMKWFDQTFTMMDTQLVAIPTFLKRRCKIGPVPQANALGQVFVEVDDPEICDEMIHLQIYGYNPFIADILRARFGALFNEKLFQPFLDQMMMIMAYLPGQLSSKVTMRVISPVGNEPGLPPATFISKQNACTAPAIRQLKQKIKAHRREFGWLPAFSFAETPEPGASHHLAGGLPMRATPSAYECDILGRPGGLRNVHVVDGACFPDLPAEHLTYTIMANAVRIATQSTEGRAP